MQFSAFEEQLAECDIVIASTAAPHYVIGPAEVQRALELRSQRGLFLVDLSVPRNIDPAIAHVYGAYLYDIDDLQQVADANRERRRCKASQAEGIVTAEVRAFQRRITAEEAVPTIVELQQRDVGGPARRESRAHAATCRRRAQGAVARVARR